MKTSKAQQQRARKKAELILKVQSGEITASQAAEQLGVSRKTYYKWEKRGLAAMLEGLNERAAGRPPVEPNPEIEALKERVEQLETELRRRERCETLRQLVKEAEKKDGAL
jgi:transposase